VAATLAAAGLIANGVLLWPLFAGPRPATDPNRPVLRVLSFNVLYDNPNESGVIEFVRISNADVVILIEVNARWMRAIESLHDIYPHRHVRPREGPWGMALLSRQPWTSLRADTFGTRQPAALVATFTSPAGPFLFVGAHPTTPINADGARGRDAFLAQLASHIGQNDTPEIVAGDLNATRWSAAFQRLFTSAGLRDSAGGRGWQPTWKTGSIFQIPIDHVLVSSHWTVTDRRIGPNLGSDHRPLVVDLQFRRGEAD
jgi:endonuclease/exonuclease/phosphatase (EEP) superfamily protein YafD